MKNDNTPDSRELSDNDMDQVAGGLSVGTFDVRGGDDTRKLAKISEGGEVLSEFVAKLTTG